MAIEHTTDRAQSTHLSQKQLVAIRGVKRAVEKILTEKHEVLSAIVARRLRRETCASIAKEEDIIDLLEDLGEDLGVMTFSVRKSIIESISKAAIAEDLNKQIVSEILSRRPTNLTDESRRMAREALQIYNWNGEIDSKLLEVSRTLLHTKPSTRPGLPNWKLIADEMKKLFGIDLRPEQWMARARQIRSRMPNAKPEL